MQAPDQHQTSTVQEPDEHHTSPADSLLLIPDSLNPITDSLSPPYPLGDGEGDSPKKEAPKKDHRAEIKEIWSGYQFSPELEQAVRNWGEYKAERNDKYKPRGFKSLLTQIETNAKTYGDAAVIEVINKSMANNWSGIIWDKIEQAKTTQPSRAAPPNGTPHPQGGVWRNGEQYWE
jgi:hypothetical protein